MLTMTPPAKSPEKLPEKAPEKPPEKPIVKSAAKTPTMTAGDKSKTPPARQTPAKPAPKPIGVRLDVQIFDDKPLIAAFVMRSPRHALAIRVIELTPSGISVHCKCESLAAQPTATPIVQRQMRTLLCRSLNCWKNFGRVLNASNKVHYLSMRQGNVGGRAAHSCAAADMA